MKYLLTGFLNQDPLENFFSVIRNRGGYNPTPNVRQCRIAIQHNVNIRLQTAMGTGNCEIDECSTLELEDGLPDQVVEHSTPHEIPQTSDVETEATVYCSTSESINNSLPAINSHRLEVCSNTYVAGYLAYMAKKKFSCEGCSSEFTCKSTDLIEKNELLLFADHHLNLFNW